MIPLRALAADRRHCGAGDDPRAQARRIFAAESGAEVIDEFHAAVADGRPPLHAGAWATATVEVCIAMQQSARERREVSMEHQARIPPP